MAEFCIFQIRKYPFTEKFLKFTVWRGVRQRIISSKWGFCLEKADILKKCRYGDVPASLIGTRNEYYLLGLSNFSCVSNNSLAVLIK